MTCGRLSGDVLRLGEIGACDLGDCLDGRAVLSAAALRLSCGSSGRRIADRCDVSGDGAAVVQGDYQSGGDCGLGVRAGLGVHAGDRGLEYGLAVDESGVSVGDDVVSSLAGAAAEGLRRGDEWVDWAAVQDDE